MIFVPGYLHGRSRKVILHYLERRSNSRKYELAAMIMPLEFLQYKDPPKTPTQFDFRISTNEPLCTSPDWLLWRIPCKHFPPAIFRLFDKWGWDRLPESYKNEPHISSKFTDTRVFEGSNNTLVTWSCLQKRYGTENHSCLN